MAILIFYYTVSNNRFGFSTFLAIIIIILGILKDL